jgi:hypothetical protein
MIFTLQLVLAITTSFWGPQAAQPRGDSTAVFLVGSFHNNHFQERFHYSMHDLTTQVLALKPDLVCGEIAPEAYQQPLEGYFPPEAVWLDEVAREHAIRFAPMDWRMETARQNEAEDAEPAAVKERARAHGEKLMSGINRFAGTSIYDHLHGDDCLSAIDVMYEQIKGENTVGDIAAGSWHERNRRMAANCLNAAAGAKRIVMVAGIDHVPQLRRQFLAQGIEAQVPTRRFTPAGQGAGPAAVLARWQRNLENLRGIRDGRIAVSADALLKVKGSRRIQDLEEAIRFYSNPMR